MKIRNVTHAEFLERYRAIFASAPIAAEGWPHQCRCGEMTVIKYRGRFYCRQCGNRWRFCPYKILERECNCSLPAYPRRG